MRSKGILHQKVYFASDLIFWVKWGGVKVIWLRGAKTPLKFTRGEPKNCTYGPEEQRQVPQGTEPSTLRGSASRYWVSDGASPQRIRFRSVSVCFWPPLSQMTKIVFRPDARQPHCQSLAASQTVGRAKGGRSPDHHHEAGYDHPHLLALDQKSTGRLDNVWQKSEIMQSRF